MCGNPWGDLTLDFALEGAEDKEHPGMAQERHIHEGLFRL